MGVGIVEVISPERINLVAATLELIEGSPLEFMTGWELSGRAQQKTVRDVFKKDEPEGIVGSPPSTMFARLQIIQWTKHSWSNESGDPFGFELTKAEEHAALSCSMYRHQHGEGEMLHSRTPMECVFMALVGRRQLD